VKEQPGDEWGPIIDGVLMFMIKALSIIALLKYIVTH
jgi:hypothetical protein